MPPFRNHVGTHRLRPRKYQSHVRAHEEVINNKFWYGDDGPSLGRQFSASKMAERQQVVIELLWKAAKKEEKAGNKKLAEEYGNLGDKLNACSPRAHCGSLGCPPCARAFQRAKVAAQDLLIAELAKKRTDRRLVFVSVIPKGMTYAPGQFSQIDIPKANRRLKVALKPIGMNRIMVGSADLGWETRRGGKYIQLHWHLAMWTSNPTRLEKKLKSVFTPTKKYERPVDVTLTRDNGFLAYMSKGIKWPDLLRRNRTHIPELLVALDRMDPLELMVLRKLRLSAQHGRIAIRPIGN